MRTHRSLLAVAAVLAAILAVPAPATAQRPAGTAHGTGADQPKPTAYVDVAAATLWTEPGIDRAIDAPATGNPVDLRAWTDGLSAEQRVWLVGNLETQAVYGTKVTILGRDGDWVHVAVDGQPTPRNPLGYPGWLPAVQITGSPAFAARQDRPFALVTAEFSGLYPDRGLRHRSLELSMDTRLPVLGRSGDAIRVATPDRGPAWLPARDAHVYASASDIPAPTGADLVDTARMFVGLPYVWAGVSAWGYDCSGFTYSVYHVHGVTIPRDADAEFAAGTPVDKDAMRPGDLIFYAHSNGYIHHVGMYIGDGYEIDAPGNTSTTISTVEIVKVDEHRYADQYAGSRRFL